MQYRARGRKSVGPFPGAGVKLLKTNSGLSILPRCSRKEAFHGAAFGGAEFDVEAILRWKVRETSESRAENWEAMIAIGFWFYGKEKIYTFSSASTYSTYIYSFHETPLQT